MTSQARRAVVLERYSTGEKLPADSCVGSCNRCNCCGGCTRRNGCNRGNRGNIVSGGYIGPGLVRGNIYPGYSRRTGCSYVPPCYRWHWCHWYLGCHWCYRGSTSKRPYIGQNLPSLGFRKLSLPGNHFCLWNAL